MAGRSNTTLKKRQKEMARAEKQREKFAKRLDKKKEPGEQGDGSFEIDELTSAEQLALESAPVSAPVSA